MLGLNPVLSTACSITVITLQCVTKQPYATPTYVTNNPFLQVLKKDRISQKDVAKLLAEKDEIIVDLREEGENLSRQAGKHSEIIKKLRTKEKSLEKELNSTKNSLEERTKVFETVLKCICFESKTVRRCTRIPLCSIFV